LGDVFIPLPVFSSVLVILVSNIVYLKCSNPGCGKLNPVYSEVKPGGEYTCVFCGQLFNAPIKAADEVLDEKKRNRGKKLMQRESPPENRNMRKPML
jgi:hypothetical protein